MADAPIDGNTRQGLIAVSSSDGSTIVKLYADPITHRLLVDATGSGGTVTDVSVVTANGFAGTVATSTSTPAITLTTTVTGILSGNGTAISAASTTGSGAVVLDTSPALTTPDLGTPSAVTLTNGTGLPIGSGVSGLGTGVATALGVNIGSAGAPVLFNGALGTPSSGTLTNVSGLPLTTGVTGTLGVTNGGTGVATISALSVWVANTLNTITEVTPSAGQSIRVNGAGNAWEAFTPSAAVPTAITVANEATDTSCFLGFFTAATGDLGPKTNANLTFNSNTGVLTLVAPVLGTPTSVTLTNATGLPVSTGISGLGTNVATALAVNVGSAGAFVVNGGALGTPSSGTLTNATGLPIVAGTTGTLSVARGGTGLTTISALSIWVANTLDTVTEVTPGAGQSIRVNGAGNAWEAFTPSASVPTTITVANEATDTSCFIGFFTAATGDLGPNTNANLTFNSSTGVLTAAQTIVGSVSGNAGTASAVAVGGITGLGTGVATALAINVGSAGAFVTFNGALGTPSSGTVTNLTGTASININGTVGATTPTTATFTTATINTNLVPDANDGAGLGLSGTAFSDLFLASGALIDFAAGNAVITHSSGILTVSTGDLRVTTAGTNTASAVTVGGTQTLTSKTLTSPAITTATLSGTQLLAEGASIGLDPSPSADGVYSGTTVTGTAGATLAFGDLIYLDPTDSRWELADANAASGADGDSRGILGICVLAAAADGDPTTILLNGIVRADAAFPALTVNNPVYVSETAGDITQTQPTTTDVVIRVLGAALTADSMYFNPDQSWITHT